MKKKSRISISVKQRIYLSFSVLVLLFVVNGIITIVTLNSNKKLSNNISAVIEPSLQSIEDFENILVNSKMYTTNWVFLRSNQNDKDALLKLHNTAYPKLKAKLNSLIPDWDNRSMADSLQQVFVNFEQLLLVEKKLMASLKKFEDYDDPVIKLEAEAIVEDELLPRTSALMNALGKVASFERELRTQNNNSLEHSSMTLRTLISVLAFIIVGIGIFLSLYMSKAIISPINKIRHIVNDLGKGIIRKVDHKVSTDEIGSMVLSVNNLSEKLQAMATFASEIGQKNFNTYFEPLSADDSLGIALVAMRDNIKLSDAKLNDAQHIARIGSWERDIKTNKMTLSDEMLNIIEVDPSTFDFHFSSIIKLMHPDDVEHAMTINRENLYMEPVPYECRIITAKGVIKYVFVETKIVLGALGEPEKTFGIIQDITKRKADEELLRQSEASLEINNKELLQKNKELEQFAYVASHDLQEPLRTTSSFVQLLQRKYRGRLDDNADKYLTYIMNASDRMQVLIKDLLDYSLIGSKKTFKKIDCNSILQEVQADLGTAIAEAHAEIIVEELPLINGYNSEIKQLFQNLIMNAVKFRKKDVSPQIKIASLKNDDYWEFTVKDNGIGIDEQHKDRIFLIFQRLHTRTVYEGSGIGLSHCKKIVELHGGRIWIESKPGEGTTFHFTIHKKIGLERAKELSIAC
ncbi:MAG: Histidine kinase [Ferruginibacter sp.]|uniref:ATP-binding protein n=1 Tax=Ferruginibacter sp. TaxID=1940288 RepID=UPI002657AF6F|nr:ATP-binding protein [Ferruginibacter sp.]MDB5280210.1 Histidine kinase [Ferruginibacter sp.]